MSDLRQEDPTRSRGGVEVPDGWQGTEPNEGTRRALIRDALMEARLGAEGCDTARLWALELADAVESALLKSTIADEEQSCDQCGATLNSKGGCPHELDHLVEGHADTKKSADDAARRAARQVEEYRAEHAEAHRILDELDIPKGPEIGPPTVLNRLRELVDARGDYDRLLNERESARVGESTAMAQRDAALHLLRWLIGDLIPPELVGLHKDEDDENCEGMGV